MADCCEVYGIGYAAAALAGKSADAVRFGLWANLERERLRRGHVITLGMQSSGGNGLTHAMTRAICDTDELGDHRWQETQFWIAMRRAK